MIEEHFRGSRLCKLKQVFALLANSLMIDVRQSRRAMSGNAKTQYQTGKVAVLNFAAIHRVTLTPYP